MNLIPTSIDIFQGWFMAFPDPMLIIRSREVISNESFKSAFGEQELFLFSKQKEQNWLNRLTEKLNQSHESAFRIRNLTFPSGRFKSIQWTADVFRYS